MHGNIQLPQGYWEFTARKTQTTGDAKIGTLKPLARNSVQKCVAQLENLKGNLAIHSLIKHYG